MKGITKGAVVLTVLGHAFVVIGMLGILLPIVPTTPFLLCACACYARGSPRHHKWIHNNRYMGPILHDWETTRSIPMYAKVMATAVLISSFCWVIVSDHSIPTIVVFGILFTIVSVWILTRPTSERKAVGRHD